MSGDPSFGTEPPDEASPDEAAEEQEPPRNPWDTAPAILAALAADKDVDVKAENERWPKGRELTSDEIAEILDNHRLWKQTDGKEGQRGDLSYANLVMQNAEEFWLPEGNLRGVRFSGSNLKNAVFINADLRGAALSSCDLREASFHEADLRGAYLRDAKLSGAHFRDADLRGAFIDTAVLESEEKSPKELEEERQDLREWLGEGDEDDEGEDDLEIEVNRPAADLTGANLRGADLSDARLSDVTGLRSASLAGTNLSNAKLPGDIAKFELLDFVAEISKAARSTYLTMIGASFYCLLSVATTDPASVERGTTTTLPVIDTDISVSAFFVVAPIVVLGLYVYLHMYLLRLWEGLGSLPAYFPDGRALDERAYPWMLTSLVRLYVPLLVDNRQRLWWLQVGISILTAWLVVPITTAAFLIRYAPQGSPLGTAAITVVLAASLVLAVATFVIARTQLRGA